MGRPEVLIAQPLGPPARAAFFREPEGRRLVGVWIDVVGTGAPTSLRPKMGFCPPCLSPPTSSRTLGFQMERWQATFFFKGKK